MTLTERIEQRDKELRRRELYQAWRDTLNKEVAAWEAFCDTQENTIRAYQAWQDAEKKD